MARSRHGGCSLPVPQSLGEGLIPAERTPLMEPFNLTVWLPAVFALGLAALGLMFAFTAACEKV